MSAEVHCLYCGAKVGEEEATCPRCGAPSHFQQRGWRAGGRRRFLIWFVLFVMATLLVAVWLPR